MITAVQKRDFRDIYNEHKEQVWRLVSRYASSPHDREDLFQEVFLAVHRALPRFRGDSALGTWIHRIAVNTSLNHLRKRKRYRWLKELLSGFRQETNEGPGDPSLVPLEKLNPRQRTILILSDVEEMKLEEIAETLKLPLGTVKSNLFRAREIVKREVERNG